MSRPTAHRAAVLGSPVAHSLSPVLHRAAWAELGLSGWTYSAYDVDEPALEAFLTGLDDSWAGLSLTMPLKAAVLPLLDESSPLVRRVGAANTVLLREGRRSGENTDVPGMVAALAAQGVRTAEEAVVLGGGATARAAVAALSTLTADIRVYLRDPARRAGLERAADGSGVRLLLAPWERAAEGLSAPLVVSTTPAGATDRLAAAAPAGPGTLFEVVYDPWPTALAAAWGRRGGAVVDGLHLLVHQAVLQVALMTGRDVAAAGLPDVLRAAGEKALGARNQES